MNRKLSMTLLFLTCGFMSFSQMLTRQGNETNDQFIFRSANGNYIKDKVVITPFNNQGEKLLYFYYRMVKDTFSENGKDSLTTIRMTILFQDTINSMQYEAFDFELDTDHGYGLGIESTEIIKSKKEKSVNITVYHLTPGPGKIRYKNYEHFVVKQRKNNGGYFNDFELIRIR